MVKRLFYDCEIAKCIGYTHSYKYCEGWHDFENMGIAVIGVYAEWKLPGQRLRAYVNPSRKIAEALVKLPKIEKRRYWRGFRRFEQLVSEADEIIGFNSISFDDNLCQSNDIDVKTTHDLLLFRCNS